MPSMQHQSISISYSDLEKMTKIQNYLKKVWMNCLLGWFYQSMSKKIKKKLLKYAILLLISRKWPNTQFLDTVSYKKVLRGCEVGMILAKNVESAENIVTMQYQVILMNQTQENGYVWKTNHPLSFGSTIIKLWW